MPGPFILFGPPEPGPIELVEYKSEWAQRFNAERERLAPLLGSVALSIAHIGSTAVPGLAAKPVIDVGVLVSNLDALDARVPELELGGYMLRVSEFGHRMFRTAMRNVHVHAWQLQAEFERHLLFRDRLRASPQDRALYERVKRELAKKNWASRTDYAAAKSETIAAILSRAVVR
ncbi:MAG TPA: GrpB family protein [Candidatus Acidoferrales bacterium]|nr:GrpB family protein [Candidatus Acidoferrales bacterium]